MSNAPALLQPRLKAPSTSVIVQNTVHNESLSHSTPSTQRISARQAQSIDPLSDKTTVTLIRRTLCSNSVEKEADVLRLLPPLTSSNEVDLQLYALISITLRDFVQSWYGKITEDRVFIDETVKLIAHCTRAIETRMRMIDIEALIFDELPELLLAHIKIHRTAFRRIHPTPLRNDPKAVYHSLWPLPALTPVPNIHDTSTVEEQKENEAVYRQLLVDGILAILLPTEDLENGCLTALVGQIFSEMIIGNGIGGKACEPWLLWELLTKIALLLEEQKSRHQVQQPSNVSPAYNHEAKSETSHNMTEALPSMVISVFWTIVQYMYAASSILWSAVIILRQASMLPDRPPLYTRRKHHAPLVNQESTASPHHIKDQDSAQRRPILCMKLWACVVDLLDLTLRMPWLYAFFSAMQWIALRGPWNVGRTNGLIDKLLVAKIQQHVLDPALLPLMLRSVRAAIFPNNAPGMAREVPSTDEQLVIRRTCAQTLLQLFPDMIVDTFFGKEESQRLQEVEDILNIFGDTYCNKHLIYGVVELLIVRLCPEMATKSVEELWADRLD